MAAVASLGFRGSPINKDNLWTLNPKPLKRYNPEALNLEDSTQ